jgi:3-deoxy-manno-octulosonate cytidylyltransferase (CMP-KDO synthetase)
VSNTVLVIPARYASTRLPGKPLREIAGKPMIQHVFERAEEATKALGFQSIIIATDDQRIQKCCEDFGATVCMTSNHHETGSDRLAEVVTINGWADDTTIVNLQGDEPLTPISSLKQVAENLENNPQASIATLATPLSNRDEYHDPNVVKVVTDKNGLAMYFSRASIPFERDVQSEASDHFNFALRHIGIYAYRAGYLKSFAQMEPCEMEQLEKLEQLRAMWHGARIHVAVAKEVPGHGVDTKDDLIAVEKILLDQKS